MRGKGGNHARCVSRGQPHHPAPVSSMRQFLPQGGSTITLRQFLPQGEAPSPCASLYHKVEAPSPCASSYHKGAVPSPCASSYHKGSAPSPCASSYHKGAACAAPGMPVHDRLQLKRPLLRKGWPERAFIVNRPR